jgi:hypothetical protein
VYYDRSDMCVYYDRLWMGIAMATQEGEYDQKRETGDTSTSALKFTKFCLALNVVNFITMANNTITFDEETITRLMHAAMLMGAGQAQGTPTVGAPTTTVVEKALSWNDFPKWPGRCDRVDAWFQSFEAKMKAARILEVNWSGKLMECPKLGEELKRRLSRLEDTSYEGIRRHCLEVYGPVEPVGYFRLQMFNVRGNTREEVMEKLEDYRALHNRAARLVGKPEWEDNDLLYPFINAFPEPAATRLKQELASALRSGNALQELISRAPSQVDPVEEEKPPLIAAVDAGSRGQKRKIPEEGALVAALRDFTKELKGQRTQQKRPRVYGVPPVAAPNPTCKTCGRPVCYGTCPAKEMSCRRCGKLGHFARVCPVGGGQQVPQGRPEFEGPPRRPRGPPFPGQFENQGATRPPFMRGQRNLQ